MINKDNIKRATKQMEWEIENCGRPIKECISCQDASVLLELAKKYLGGEINERKE